MLNEDINAITSRFRTLWTSVELPVVYSLAPQTEHRDGWIEFTVALGASNHAFGDPVFGTKRQQGRIWFEVIIPDQRGDGQAMDLIEAFCPLFRNWRDNYITCKTEELSGPFVKDGMARFRVSIYFYSLRPYS